METNRLGVHEQRESQDWLRFYAQVLLGRSLECRQKYAETEPILVAGYEGMKAREQAIPARFKKHVPRVLDWIIQFYEARGKPVQAAQWRAKQEPAAPAPDMQP